MQISTIVSRRISLCRKPIYLSATNFIVISLKSRSMSGAAADSKNYLLEYDYVEGILEKRIPHREEHIKLLQDLTDKNVVVSAGPTVPPTKAFFYFSSTSRGTVEQFVADDPYVKHNLVTNSVIHDWNVVIGSTVSKL